MQLCICCCYGYQEMSRAYEGTALLLDEAYKCVANREIASFNTLTLGSTWPCWCQKWPFCDINSLTLSSVCTSMYRESASLTAATSCQVWIYRSRSAYILSGLSRTPALVYISSCVTQHVHLFTFFISSWLLRRKCSPWRSELNNSFRKELLQNYHVDLLYGFLYKAFTLN